MTCSCSLNLKEVWTNREPCRSGKAANPKQTGTLPSFEAGCYYSLDITRVLTLRPSAKRRIYRGLSIHARQADHHRWLQIVNTRPSPVSTKNTESHPPGLLTGPGDFLCKGPLHYHLGLWLSGTEHGKRTWASELQWLALPRCQRTPLPTWPRALGRVTIAPSLRSLTITTASPHHPAAVRCRT